MTAESNIVFEDQEVSDDDVESEAHDKLLDAVSQLYKKQKIEAPKRREPANQVSEFNLSSGQNEDDVIKVKDLLSVLNTRATHKEISDKVKTTQKKSKTLKKPLEKIYADRITRSVGYRSVQTQLNKWEAIVMRNRAAGQLQFPLKEKEVEIKTLKSQFKDKTELEKSLEAIFGSSKVEQEERALEESLLPLSLEEMIEKRKMIGKMRARESYRIAKAVRQNKIKSKKYHRVLKREKIKKELKDFELLQKTNPEAALEKLEEIERARAQERISLRHKNTGKWARSKAIRAKYDREARIELAEQLTKSRELTKKVKSGIDSSTEEEEEKEEEDPIIRIDKQQKTLDENNPWFQTLDPNVPFQPKPLIEVVDKSLGEKTVTNSTNTAKPTINSQKEENETIDLNSEKEDEVVVETKVQKSPLRKRKKKKTSVGNRDQAAVEDSQEKPKETQTVIKSSKWTIEDIFEGVESDLQEKLSHRIKKVKTDLRNAKKERENENKKERNHKPDLSMRNEKTKISLDDELIEVTENSGISTGENDVRDLLDKLNSTKEIGKQKLPEIDPTNFLPVKQKQLLTQVPLLEEEGDLAVEEQNGREKQHMDLVEAFAEDDVIDEFRREKQEEIDASKPKDIDLTLPGWGHWAGTNMTKRKKRQNRRFMIKFPELPRKDDKRDIVIIHENVNSELKNHLVNDLPFPFKSVEDYEASIRAPIGSTWLPQTVHQHMIEPHVVTKMGKLIEPMDHSQLAKKQKI